MQDRGDSRRRSPFAQSNLNQSTDLGTLIQAPNLLNIHGDLSYRAARPLRDMAEEAGVAEHVARDSCHRWIGPSPATERAEGGVS